MKGHGPVKCSQSLIGTPGQIRWIRRGGGSSSGSGPSGWKLKPSRLLSRSLAEMAIKYRALRKPAKVKK